MKNNSLEIFKLKLEEVNNTIDVIGEYEGTKTPILVHCKICGNDWTDSPTHLLSGRSCPYCRKSNRDKLRAEKFLNAFNTKDRNVILLDDYVSGKQKMHVKCLVCGEESFSTPSAILNDNGCRRCTYNKRRLALVRSESDFLLLVKESHPDITVHDHYINNTTLVTCSCNECGHTWSVVPKTLLRGPGCPECFFKMYYPTTRTTHEDFVLSLAQINDTIEVVGTYEKSNTYIRARCKQCANEFYAKPNSLLNGHGCPICNNQSRGEMRIRSYLKVNEIEFMEQVKFDDLRGVGGGRLSFDFYIPQINTLVEFQGSYHDGTSKIQTAQMFEKQQEHDKRKKEYAIQHGYNFIEIWYQQYHEIPSIFNQLLNIHVPVTTKVS